MNEESGSPSKAADVCLLQCKGLFQQSPRIVQADSIVYLPIELANLIALCNSMLSLRTPLFPKHSLCHFNKLAVRCLPHALQCTHHDSLAAHDVVLLSLRSWDQIPAVNAALHFKHVCPMYLVRVKELHLAKIIMVFIIISF